MAEEDDEKSNMIKQIGLLTVIPVLMVVGPLAGFFIGRWLDGWLKSEPWLTVLFIVFGFVAAGKEIYNILRKLNKTL